MSVTCYPSRGKVKASKMCRSFADGCGGSVAKVGQRHLVPGPAFFYGWTNHTAPLIEQCRVEGRDWYYADNAYYFGRGDYFRITRNALMLTGETGGNTSDKRRLAKFDVSIKPWRESGDHIVIATQSELFYSERLGVSRDDWVNGVIGELKRHTDREIVICHKSTPPWPRGRPHANFEDALPGAWAVVSHSSSCMVKALLDGVPVFSLAPSMVGQFGSAGLEHIEAPPRPGGRRALMGILAANQWTFSEMERCVAWKALQGSRAAAA